MMRKSSLHFTRDATVLLFPVILVIFVLVYNISAIFKIHQQAEHDLNIIERATLQSVLIQELQRERGLNTVRSLKPDNSSITSMFMAQKQQTQRVLEQMKNVLSPTQFNDIQNRINTMRNNANLDDSERMYLAYSFEIRRTLVDFAGILTQLKLKSEPFGIQTHLHLMSFIEALGQQRNLVGQFIIQDSLSDTDYALFLDHNARVDMYRDFLIKIPDTQFTQGLSSYLQCKAHADCQTVVQSLREDRAAPLPDFESWWTLSTDAIDAAYKVEKDYQTQLSNTIKQHRSSERLHTLMYMALELLIVIGLMFLFRRLQSRAQAFENNLFTQAQRAMGAELLHSTFDHWRQSFLSLAQTNQDLREAIQHTQIDETTRANMLEQVQLSDQLAHSVHRIMLDFDDLYRGDAGVENIQWSSVLNKTQTLLGNSIEQCNARIKVEGDADSYLRGLKQGLQQILLNLIQFSIYEAKLNSVKRPVIEFKIESRRANVVVNVSHNCGPLSETLLNHLFEPPKITSTDSHSHALNLYLTQLILTKSFGGHIKAENSTTGVNFTLVFPRGFHKS